MRSLPVRSQAYIYFLAIVSLLIFLISFFHITFNSYYVVVIIISSILICLTDLYSITLPYGDNYEVTVSCAIKAAVAILYGPYISVITTIIGTLGAEIIMRRVWYKMLFNICQMALTAAGMSLVYALLYDPSYGPFQSVQNIVAFLCLTMSFYLINSGLVIAIVSLSSHLDFWYVWRTNLKSFSLNYLTVIPMGGVIATVVSTGHHWAVVGLILPLVIIRQSIEFVAELQRQTRTALVSMADAIDQRDPSTFEHSMRVSYLGEALARQLDLSGEEIETIRMAGRLHDLGKIGMSNSLLYKPGVFTEEEYAIFRRHPLIGAELVQSFRLFREGQDLILHHHERYDGTGYPMGLAGDEIPIGARVLAVADSFDAMVSFRLYRPSMTLAQAIEELEANRSTQFDPQVVDAFQRLFVLYQRRLPWYAELSFEGIAP